MTGSRVRLFVALELPGSVRAAVGDWRRPILSRHPGLRSVASDAMHVTLCFLGSRSEDAVSEIGASVVRTADRGEPVRLHLAEGVWLPRRRPRVLAVALADEAGALGRIQEGLSQELERGGWYEPGARPFLPHATVARVRGHERVRPDELPPVPELEFTGSRVTLFRSQTGRGGARYEPLAGVAV